MNTKNTRSLPHWHATESLLLRTRRHDVLIEGPVEATGAALLQMQPHIPRTDCLEASSSAARASWQ
jgi:hypothetical protein